MKTTTKYVAPWLAAAAIGGAIALAPIASADTDPLVPFGTDRGGRRNRAPEPGQC